MSKVHPQTRLCNFFSILRAHSTSVRAPWMRNMLDILRATENKQSFKFSLDTTVGHIIWNSDVIWKQTNHAQHTIIFRRYETVRDGDRTCISNEAIFLHCHSLHSLDSGITQTKVSCSLFSIVEPVCGFCLMFFFSVAVNWENTKRQRKRKRRWSRECSVNRPIEREREMQIWIGTI